jgi:hypothetical protein
LAQQDNDIRFVELFDDAAGTLSARIALEKTPEFAAGIGIFLAFFTTCDLLTASVLARLMECAEPEALQTLERLNGYAPRLNLIEARTRERKPTDQSFFNMFVSEMRWLNAERNKYAHAQYGIGLDTGRVYRGLWVTEGKRTTEWEVLTLEKIKADIERARRFLVTVWNHMGAS